MNLKQYLTKDEVRELYKYAIYNGIMIMLIDSFNYGVTLKDENNQTIYYTINNGVIDLKNIIIPVKNVNNITIVTGDRQAYNSGCNTTDVIFIKE